MKEDLCNVSQVRYVNGYKVLLVEPEGEGSTSILFSQWKERIGEVYDCTNPYEAYRSLMEPELDEAWHTTINKMFKGGVIPSNTYIEEKDYCHIIFYPPKDHKWSDEDKKGINDLMNELNKLDEIWTWEYR